MISILFRTKEIMACLLLLLVGCNSEQFEIPARKKDAPQCQGIGYHYTKDIKPILDQYCVDCHKNNGTSIFYDTYVLAQTIARDGSRLSDAINWKGSIKMPLGGSKLPDSLIKKIECWILNDTPE